MPVKVENAVDQIKTFYDFIFFKSPASFSSFCKLKLTVFIYNLIGIEVRRRIYSSFRCVCDFKYCKTCIWTCKAYCLLSSSAEYHLMITRSIKILIILISYLCKIALYLKYSVCQISIVRMVCSCYKVSSDSYKVVFFCHFQFCIRIISICNSSVIL